MNYKKYSQETWSLIRSEIKKARQESIEPVAVFDADGTLWDCDLGENFFQYQIDRKLVPLPENAFQHYLDMKKINDDPRPAYLWLAQICKGVELSKVQGWAQAAFEEIKPSPIFDEQRQLISLLKESGVRIKIVTASIKWAVEPGALALGLDRDAVIGVETQVLDHKITDAPVFPVTYRAGKVEALKKSIGATVPFLGSGNSIGDLELLNYCSSIKLVVSAASMDDRLYKSERELQVEAQKKNWIVHRYI